MAEREHVISDNIRLLRMKHHYTREEFSEEIGVSTNFLYRIEAGTAGMSLKTLLRILDVLEVDANTLFGTAAGRKEIPDYYEEVVHILSDCNDKETLVIVEMLKHLRLILKVFDI